MSLTYRQAKISDIPTLEVLIPLSVHGLQKSFYTTEQIEAAIGTVFGVDSQLIADGTYFVAEDAGQIVACGGWSKRKTPYGSDASKKGENLLRDPKNEPAMIRAFFVHPSHARRGIGRRFIEMCEEAIVNAGFTSIDIVATLAGEPLYAACGYRSLDRHDIALRTGGAMMVVKMSKTLIKN